MTSFWFTGAIEPEVYFLNEWISERTKVMKICLGVQQGLKNFFACTIHTFSDPKERLP